jgi:hypothetical protein
MDMAGFALIRSISKLIYGANALYIQSVKDLYKVSVACFVYG